MPEDPQSEFERIFGKTQKGSDAKSTDGTSSAGMTQKLASDSDLLGIRTDSDRFLVKSVPETLPSDASTKAASVHTGSSVTPSQDAMTIALNVNVFANIADPQKTTDPKSGQPGKDKAAPSGTWPELVNKQAAEAQGAGGEGTTFVIPLPKDPVKGGAEVFKVQSSAATATPTNDEFTRVLSPKNIPATPSVDTEFTRVMHMEDAVKVPKPTFPASTDDSAAGATIAITDSKGPSASAAPVPTVITPSGPSDFTKVVKGSELRSLQEKMAAAQGSSPSSWPAPAPAQYSAPAQPWQSASQAPVPQYVPAPNSQWPGSAMPQPPGAPQPSKLSQYMPLIVVLNLLFLLAVLLIVFFALKK